MSVRLKGNIYERQDSPFLWLWYRDAKGVRHQLATEFVQGQERRARALLEEVLRQVAAGEVPFAAVGSVQALIERWLADRKAAGKRSVAHEAARLREYVVPRLGGVPAAELRPAQVRTLVRELQQTESPRGGLLAARTVLHVYRTLRQVFTEAVADELLDHNRVILKRSDLPAKLDKDPSWRAGALFAAAEVGALVFDPRVPEDRRTLYAIELLGGLRTGEAAARRWRDWDEAVAPLGSLLVATSFDSRTHTEGPTKTRRPRRVPVHPVTAEVLARWKADGWERTFGRSPEPDDLICPSASGRFRTAQLSYNHFADDLARLGLRHRRHYDTRRTFISLGVAGGGRKDVLRWITHSPGDVFDEYTTLPWETLCEAVTAIRITVSETGAGPELGRTAPAGTDAVTLAVTLADPRSARNDEAPGTIQFRGPLEWRGVGDSNPWPPA